MTPSDETSIARLLVDYFRLVQRDLPWRRTRDPYAIWVSEIMLQQTRVATVIPYFERWLEQFPTVERLADAPLDQVLAAWSGLGYYSRARNLHKGAQYVVEHFAGQVPSTVRELRSLPGVGRYTAGAVASIGFGHREPVVDGNVARVLARLFAIEGDIKASAATRKLWALADELVPADAPGDFNQGLMELGATVCTPTSPSCLICPLHRQCEARIRGLERELPNMPKRKARASLPLIDASALWIAHDNAVILARRTPTGLYGGLWELPQTEQRAGLSELVQNAQLSDPQPVYEHRQTLTHRRLRICVYQAELPNTSSKPRKRRPVLGKPLHERYDQLLWQPLSALSQRGISAATRSIVDAFLENDTWNSTKKP